MRDPILHPPCSATHVRGVQGGRRRSMLWAEHLCTSKLYKRLWASSLQMEAARSQRQPHACLQQETSFLFTADMFLCSTCTMQWSFKKKGPYHRGLKKPKKVHLLNAQTVLSLVSVLFWLVGLTCLLSGSVLSCSPPTESFLNRKPWWIVSDRKASSALPRLIVWLRCSDATLINFRIKNTIAALRCS